MISIDHETSKEKNTEEEIATLAHGAGVGMAGKILGRGLLFLTQVIVARFLGATQFGLFLVGWSVIRILEAVGPLGMDQAIIRFGSEAWTSRREILRVFVRNTVFLMAMIGLGWGAVIYLNAAWLGAFFGNHELFRIFRAFAWMIPLIVLLQITSAATRVSKRMKFSTLGRDLGQPIINLLLIFFFLLSGLTVTKSIIALIISYGGALLLTLYFLHGLFPGLWRFQIQGQTPRLVPQRILAKFAISASTVESLPILFGWGMHLLLAYFRPASDVGIYQAAFQLSALFSVAFMPGINAVFAPMAASLHEQQRPRELEEIYRVSTKWAIYLSIPFFVLILHSPIRLLNAVYGVGYGPGALILVLLVVAQFVNVATGPVGYLLINTGHQKDWARITFVSAVTGIVLGLVCVPRWGIVGAAIANCIALVVMYGSGLLFAKKSLGYWPYDKRYVKGLISGGVSIGSLLILQSSHMLDSVSNTAATLIYFLTSISFFGFALVLLRPDPDDKIVIALVKKAIWKQRDEA